jgi:two-component system, sensor histidine kinase and response regulator
MIGPVRSALRTVGNRGGVEPSPVPILVVDDDPAKRRWLRAMLAPLGCSIVEADSGSAALRCVSAQDFAVILLDIRMPITSGIETAALIRQRRQSETTPIIFISAYGREEIREADLYAGGAIDFIFTPVPEDELRAKISGFASLYRRAEALAGRAKEVQGSADHLRLLLDAAPVGIFETDSENRYVYTNPCWSEISGITAEEAEGRVWGSIMAPTTPGGVIVELADTDVDRAGGARRVEILVPGAEPQIIVATSKAIHDAAGGITGWVGTLADVTAEVTAETALADARDKATEASRLKSDFLANMSHEIRTPMNGVIGMTELLLDTGLNARQRDYAQTVRNSGEALMSIINDILDFSKVEAGRLEIEDVGFDVRTIVHHVVDLMAGPAQTKGLELLSDIDDAVPLWVRGDPGRVRQVLTNLIGNAVKFTSAGEVVVQVAQAESGVGQHVLRFEVSDTGDGIATDKLALIFEPFAQADPSTSRKYGGTGLGLAITSKLVSLMGGDCGVSSRSGKGSDFWFTIPLRIDPGRPTLAPEESFSALVGIAALIVDDSAAQRRVLSHHLRDLGMTVNVADSGAEALAMLRTAAREARPFGVALIDHSMPDMEGLELRDLIVADPSLDIELVLMTAPGEGRETGDATSVSAALSKPIHRQDLRLCLCLALGVRVDVSSPEGIAGKAASPPPGAQVGRLLLAEDNPVNQRVAVAMLSSAGYIVDTVPNGNAAVEAATAHRYDAILMDCQMPELNGYEATAAIRALEGADRHTPIIAMTAGARPEDRERCLSAGMDSYLAKPIRKDTLVALVARWLKKGSAETVDLPSSDEITIDTEIFDELRILGEAADRDFLSELVARFVRDTDPLLARLGEAVEAGDAEAAGRIAHGLKGSCIQLGGRRLAHACDRLQWKATSGHIHEALSDLQAVQADYDDLCRTLAHHLAPTGVAKPSVRS